MKKTSPGQQRATLRRIARQAMIDKGLQPDFPPEALAELGRIQGPAIPDPASARDLRGLIWCSIDNDESRDLDQLTVAQDMGGGSTKILVAIADVESTVRKSSALDGHANHNTTSVYTPGDIFPMLPERLSTNLTSLNFDQDRLAVVVEMLVESDGTVKSSTIHTALVRNKAKLAYDSVAAWLDDRGPMPSAIGAVDGLEENLRLQDRVAVSLKNLRHAHGALDFKTIKIRPRFDGDTLKDVEPEQRNRAKDIIENFMVAANGVVAEFLAAKSLPSLRRVVRTPKRWERIVELAFEQGFTLPRDPDAKALERFLTSAQSADPLRFPDLSLAVIKLLGPGEYVVERPGQKETGHFSLAVRGYTHSTAPNRRYPDLVTQRMLKAALAGRPTPYKADDLAAVAARCTEMENNVKKVERQVEKSAAAMLLENRIGTRFDAIVTGASEKGTWVRLLGPPFVEGRLASGAEGLDVGCRLRAQLVRVDVERGYIDFKKSS